MAQPGDGSTFTWTFESWVKPKSNSDDYPIATKYDTSGTDYCSYVISIEPDGKFESEANEAYDQYSYNTTNNPVVIFDDWNYLVSTFNLNGKNQMNCFVNGTEVPSTNTKNTNVRWLGDIPVTDDVGRIRYETSTGYCDAYIDEIRWSKVVRSDEWISTSYNTMNDPSIFFSVGPEETP